ncbi:MAG: hypothetical protein J6S91_07040, partial [Treponema sp.]|nr:hypothetical protein [Treponema sp.]
GFIGCKNNAEPEPETPSSGPVSQTVIDNAIAGSVVNFDGSSEGGSITINKPLTVNGNGARNVSITISSNVRQNVVLRNFRDATITVLDIPARMARAADDEEEDKSFKYLGDDALPVKLEGCTIELFEAEKDVAIYLNNGELKSDIEEIKLKEGVEDFTFVEFDKSGIITDDKSEVGKLSIEDGVEKINLIGGTFDDVSLADDFSGTIDFKYDKEFSDQLNFAGKDAFLGDTKIVEKDVGIAEKNAGNGVFSYTISSDMFRYLNGRVFIVLKKASDPSAPIYAAIPAGLFKVDVDHKTTNSSLMSIYGSERSYIDYAAARARGMYGTYLNQDVVNLTHYRNYNKEAFVADVSDSAVTFFVDMTKIKKEDIIVCPADDSGPKDEACTKISDIDLEGYIPYFAVNENSNPSFEETQRDQVEATFGRDHVQLRSYNAVKYSFGAPEYYSVQMDSAHSYPDVSGLSYSLIAVDPEQENWFGNNFEPEDDDYLNVYTKNAYNNCDWDSPLSVERANILEEMGNRGLKYYLKSNCTEEQELTAAQIQSLAKYAFIWCIVPPSIQHIGVTQVRQSNEGGYAHYVLGDYSSMSLQDAITMSTNGTHFYLDSNLQFPVTTADLQSGAEFWGLFYLMENE